MPISVHVHKQAGLRLIVYSGHVTADDFAELGSASQDPARFDPAHKSFILFTADVDLFELDLTDFVNLDVTLSEVFAERAEHGVIRDAVVAERASVKADLQHWRNTTFASANYAYQFEMFESFDEAVRWHGLGPEWAARIAGREGFVTTLGSRSAA